MSRASERRAQGETLAAWSLMSIGEAAKHLDCSVDSAKKLPGFPWVRIGALWKADPLDVAVYVLAQKEGKTPAEFWSEHGEETPAYAGRYFRRLRKMQSGEAA